MKRDLIIFDCDGVLADSEIIFHRVTVDELAKLDLQFTLDQSIEFLSGVADENIPEIISTICGRKLSEDDFAKIIYKVKQVFESTVQSVSGVSRVLEYLEQININRCIASNAMLDHVNSALDLIGMKRFFEEDKIFNISMVKDGKPKPDLFLYAVNDFQVRPQDCLVIEDSVVGIRAAKAANIPVVGFLGGTHAKNAAYQNGIVNAKPDMVAQDADELLNILSDVV